MLYLRFLILSTLGGLGAIAGKSNERGICRKTEDCLPVGENSSGVALQCSGQKMLWTYNFGKFELANELLPTDGCNLILQRPSPSVSGEDPTLEEIGKMLSFPYCAPQAGQPQSSVDVSNTEWLEAQLGDDSEPMYILNELKETDDGMVFGNRLRRFDTRGGRKGKSIKDVEVRGLKDVKFPSPTKKGLGEGQNKSGFMYEDRTCQVANMEQKSAAAAAEFSHH